MQEAYVNVNNIPTHILTRGKWIEESFSNNQKEVVIIITGNPGLPGFYTKYISTIHENLVDDIPVWVIGQVGHDDPPTGSIRKVPALEGNEQLFDLNAQILHKIDFIKTYVPEHVKIHLIGHSIGAYMIVEMLKNEEIKRKIKRCYLLFPTVERMAASPNGFFFTKIISPAYCLIRLMCFLLNMFPSVLQTLFIYIYCVLFSIPKYFLGTTQKFISPTIMDKVIFLARKEMKQVKELDVELIKENVKLLKFYYGSSDGWAPKKYFYQLKERIPEVDAEIDQNNIGHAFVLRSSDEMGRKTADWINSDR